MCRIHSSMAEHSGPGCIFCTADMHRTDPTPHVTQFSCCDCARDFKNEEALAQHLRDASSHKVKKSKTIKDKEKRAQETDVKETSHPCTKCQKQFKTASALNMHLKSLQHEPLSNIKCLAHKDCKKRFNSPSGQLQHLESGRCKSKMTKKKLDEAIVRNDPRGIITSGGIVSQWTLEDASSTSSTPRSQSPAFTPTSSQFLDSYPPSGTSTPQSAPQDSINFNTGLAFCFRTGAGMQKCPLCSSAKTRTYTPDALRAHLSSSVHKCSQALISTASSAPEISFHCPRGLGNPGDKKKSKEFAAVSGLAQHLESGACSGGKDTLKRVVQYVQQEMKSLGFGDSKLLL